MSLLSPPRRQRLLQVGFAAAAFVAVAIGDRIAALLGHGGEATLLRLCGRVVAGWSLGLAFRLQFTRSARPDVRLRWMLALPAGIIAAWPLVAAEIPATVRTTAPVRMLTEATSLAGFAATALGLTLALAVLPGRRRGG